MNKMMESRKVLPGIFKPSPVTLRRNNNIELSFNNSITALYVEDNVLNQELARKIFSDIGCRLMIANDGYEALEIITRERFDLIFMDIEMPRINGYEATVIIRQNLCLKTPVIALTSRDSDTDIQTCFQAGMNDHMSKPLNKMALTHSVYRWNRRN